MDRKGEKRVEEKNIKETIKISQKKTTKLHLIASIRGAGKVDMLVKCDCCDFLGCPIDGMRKKAKKGESCDCSEDFAITELEFC